MEQNSAEFCREAAISNDYEDFIVDFSISIPNVVEELKPVCFKTVGSRYAVFQQPRDPEMELKYVDRYDYNMIPKLYGVLDTTSPEALGALKVRRQPYLSLYGRDIIIGFVDTGIDYQNPLFLNADGTTRIAAIWDQADQSGNVPEDQSFGSEYRREQINEALKSDNPLSIVPETDEISHGTFMAGLAAGGIDAENDFTGIAPNADIVMVKLKQAKPYLKNMFAIDPNKTAYSSNDIMLGVNYVWQVARRENKPVIVCLGVGTNTGDHTGRDILSSFLDDYGDLTGNCIVVGAGNEANKAHHFRGQITKEDEVVPMEIRVGSNEPGFIVEVWGQLPYLFSVSITSPTGEVIPRISPKVQPSGLYNLTFEQTEVGVRYDTREDRTGDELVFIRFRNPTEGIWTVNLYGDVSGKQTIDAWLPMEQLITPETYFIRADPDITATEPANAENIISVAAYNHVTGGIYISSSRGLARNKRQVPAIAAPGVDVYGPTGRNMYGTRSGTSVAVANTAGVCALIFEWGFVKRNNVHLSTINVRQLLISGATRTSSYEYPNNIWGYGTIDVYQTFNSLRLTSS